MMGMGAVVDIADVDVAVIRRGVSGVAMHLGYSYELKLLWVQQHKNLI